jgi:hypothetical protein
MIGYGGSENFELYCTTNHFLAANHCGRVVDLQARQSRQQEYRKH